MQQLKSVAVKAQKARIALARADEVSSMAARAMVILFVHNRTIRIAMLWFIVMVMVKQEDAAMSGERKNVPASDACSMMLVPVCIVCRYGCTYAVEGHINEMLEHNRTI